MRIKLTIEYDGTNYVGWQKQKNGISVQEEIEKCLKKLLKDKISIYVAGRTDSGVHALEQVAHFDTIEKIEPKKISSGLNYYLKSSKNSISIINSKKVSNSFHSRFSAKKRTYLYKILNRKSPSPILQNKTWWIPYKLDLDKMKDASEFFIGKNDLNSFRSQNCQAKNSIRSIDTLNIIKKKDIIFFSISAKSFLHNQVRIIIGSLINVGRGYWDAKKIKEIIEIKKRSAAGPTAPAEGLYLEKIKY